MKKLVLLLFILSTVNLTVGQCGDSNPPTITLLGLNPQTIEVCSPYSELGATATDLCDGNLTLNIIINTTAVNTSVIGSYPVTYDVTDADGNNAFQVIRMVNIVNDTTRPNALCQNATVVLDAAGNGSITTADIDNGSNDACGIASMALDTTTFGCGDIGNNTVTLTVRDNNGNSSNCTATVDVQDITNPTPSLGSLANVTAECSVASLTDPTATDNCNGTVTVSHNASLPINTQGTTVVTWTYDDGNGNTTTQKLW